MLQTVLAFAIPTVITLSAAFFYLKKAQAAQTNEGGHRNCKNSWNERSNTNRSQHNTSSRRRRQTQPSYSECAVCFENKRLVELYPCGHKSFCFECVDMIIYKSKSLCPFCRKPIRGVSG